LGRIDDAAQQAKLARAVVDDLGATLPDDLRAAFFGQVALVIPSSGEHRTAKQQSPLTTRERDVAALVAHGLSNRAIGQRLFIGERTVETHVGNILNKLGCDSRAQIATWAIESGLRRMPE
jgi:non-specific serine/threonine protein kinase